MSYFLLSFFDDYLLFYFYCYRFPDEFETNNDRRRYYYIGGRHYESPNQPKWAILPIYNHPQ